MQNMKVKLIGLIFICITISAIVDNHCIYGSTIKRIAVLPSKINAAEGLSFLRDGIYDMFIRMQFLIDHNSFRKSLHSTIFLLFVLLLTVSPAFSGDAELTNLIVKNNNDELQKFKKQF